jgi:hypothetical protein
MEKPNISDYHEVPSSTITGANYNYKRYSQSLENYIDYLEKEVKKLNKPAVSVALHREALERVNYTLTVHGKIDADTPLHRYIIKALEQ